MASSSMHGGTAVKEDHGPDKCRHKSIEHISIKDYTKK